ncbi:MAG TPA: glycine oxidase ThiO [Terriglobales bacterium]|nr:glycine oxidase ThiO [Terriglobales bacterium]
MVRRTFQPDMAIAPGLANPRDLPLFYNAGVKNWDIIIIGAGIIGLSVARELRKRELSVLVVERGEPGREASRAAAGMLADCGDETPVALRPLACASARMYPEFAHELEDEAGTQVDLRSYGTILIGGEPAPGSSGAPLSKEQLAELEPGLVPISSPAYLLPERSVDPRALVFAALRACKHRGVDISSGDPVTSVDVAHGVVVGVSTTKTSFKAPVVVNCAGAWAGHFPPYSFPTRPIKGQMLAVVPPSRKTLRHVVRSPEVYLVPRTDGRLLIGATVEEAGYDKRTDSRTIHRMRRAAIKLVPALAAARILEDWAGLRPGTPDALPILGPTPTPGYFAATGHFRDGILLTPVTAQIMAQVICGETPSYDIRAFSPERFHS